MLRDALIGAGVSFVEVPGEAAFYGPKIDVQIVDLAGREWSLATVQVDFHQPVQFDLSYVDRDAQRRRPVMVHRSLVGSLERLFAHLIEVHQGAFPAWYAPVQVVVVPIGEPQGDAAHEFARACREAGLRAEVADEGSSGPESGPRGSCPSSPSSAPAKPWLARCHCGSGTDSTCRPGPSATHSSFLEPTARFGGRVADGSACSRSNQHTGSSNHNQN